MSDTPETDELAKSSYLQIADLISLVKKLERERDEARKLIEDLGDSLARLESTLHGDEGDLVTYMRTQIEAFREKTQHFQS
jgi:hypothetical protein